MSCPGDRYHVGVRSTSSCTSQACSCFSQAQLYCEDPCFRFRAAISEKTGTGTAAPDTSTANEKRTCSEYELCQTQPPFAHTRGMTCAPSSLPAQTSETGFKFATPRLVTAVYKIGFRPRHLPLSPPTIPNTLASAHSASIVAAYLHRISCYCTAYASSASYCPALSDSLTPTTFTCAPP